MKPALHKITKFQRIAGYVASAKRDVDNARATIGKHLDTGEWDLAKHAAYELIAFLERLRDAENTLADAED